MSDTYNLGKSTVPRDFPSKAPEKLDSKSQIKSAEDLKRIFEVKNQTSNKTQNNSPLTSNL